MCLWFCWVQFYKDSNGITLGFDEVIELGFQIDISRVVMMEILRVL